MGEIFIGILVLSVLFGGVYLLQKGTSTVGKKVNQNVIMRGSHRRGQELVSQRLEFNARASPNEVKQAILSTVKAAPHAPPVIADAHLIEAADTYVLYGFGTRLAPHSFRGLLEFEATEHGTHGSWEIINWTLTDGIVAGQSVMKRLIADINMALRSVDSEATLRDPGAGA